MRAPRLAILSVASFALAGCLRESNVEPIRETVMVHGLATVGRSSIGIVLASVSTSGSSQPLEGALVRVQRGDSEITLIESGTTSAVCFTPGADPDVEPTSGRPQCYAALLDTPIASGETFGLTVELSDGTRIDGSATTPPGPAIEEPAASSDVEVEFVIEPYQGGGFTLRETPIEVRWTGSGALADVLLSVDRIFDDGAEVECDDFFFGNSSHTRSPAFVRPPVHCMSDVDDPVWDSAYVTLHVVEYDENARDWIAATNHNGTGIVLDGASPGLEVVAGDALVSGVFGAAAPATSPITLRATLRTESPNGNPASGAPARGAAAP